MPRETSRPGTGSQRLPKLLKCISKAINSTPTTYKHSNSPSNPQVGPQEHRTWHHEDPTKDFYPILKLLFHISLLIMVLAWPVIQYPIKVPSILGIFTINLLIPPKDAELIGRHGRTREGHDPLYIRAFLKDNLILTHYMPSLWWLHLLDGPGHYII